MRPSKYFEQKRLIKPINRRYSVIVERNHNHSVAIQVSGDTEDEVLENARRQALEYGYYDMVRVSLAPDQDQPDRGTGR